MNLSSTPCTNLESYILRLHGTSRRDLKEKREKWFPWDQPTVYCYYSYFLFILFLNTVPPPAFQSSPKLAATVKRNSQILQACKWNMSPSILATFPWDRAYQGDRGSPTPSCCFPNSTGQMSTSSSPRREPALTHPWPPLPSHCPHVGPVTPRHPASWWPYSQSTPAAHVL